MAELETYIIRRDLTLEGIYDICFEGGASKAGPVLGKGGIAKSARKGMENPSKQPNTGSVLTRRNRPEERSIDPT